MNERVPERNALIPFSANYPAQVQAAGRQLGIAAQLSQDLERQRLVALLRRIPAKDALYFVLRMQPLDGDLIERFVDAWDWEFLSWATPLPWSIELIEYFVEQDVWNPLFAPFKDLPTLRPEDIIAIMEFNEARADIPQPPSYDIESFQDDIDF